MTSIWWIWWETTQQARFVKQANVALFGECRCLRMNFWWPLQKFSKKSKSTTSWWYYLTINVKNLFVSILCGIDEDNFLCIYGMTCLNMNNTGSTCCNHPEDTNWVCSTPLGCKVKAHMMPDLCKLWDEHSASGLFVNVPRGITSATRSTLPIN